MTNGQRLREISDQRGIPLRTMSDVKTGLRQIHRIDARRAMVNAMVRHGRLTPDARRFIERLHRMARIVWDGHSTR